MADFRLQIDQLTDKQRLILFLTCKGLRNAEIAAQVGIRPRTVKWHLQHLFAVFEVTNRTELVGFVAPEVVELFSSDTSGPL